MHTSETYSHEVTDLDLSYLASTETWCLHGKWFKVSLGVTQLHKKLEVAYTSFLYIWDSLTQALPYVM